MRTSILTLTLAICLVPLASARALMIAPPPLATRVAQVDAVLVGRVIGIEPNDVLVLPVAGATQKVPYRIAVVAVNEPLRGVAASKTVRVGFVAPPMPLNQPAPGLIRIRPMRRGITLDVGNEGLFLLAKHPTETFYTLPGFGYFISSQNNTNFNREVDGIKHLVKLSAQPQAALASKDAEERYLAASILIARYRTPQGSAKQEPIPQAESKRILLALADADWKQQGRERPNPMQMFYQLGVTPRDGWQPRNATNQAQIADAMRAWLRDHADTFRLQRFVTTATDR